MAQAYKDMEEDEDVCRGCGYLYVECECPDPIEQSNDDSQNCRKNDCPEHSPPEPAPKPFVVPESQLKLPL